MSMLAPALRVGAADSFVIFLSVYSFLSFLFNTLMHLMLTFPKRKRQGFLLKTSYDFNKLSCKNSIKIIEVQSKVFDWSDRFSYFLSNDQTIHFCAISAPVSSQLCLRSPKLETCAEFKSLVFLVSSGSFFLVGQAQRGKSHAPSAAECH